MIKSKIHQQLLQHSFLRRNEFEFVSLRRLVRPAIQFQLFEYYMVEKNRKLHNQFGMEASASSQWFQHRKGYFSRGFDICRWLHGSSQSGVPYQLEQIACNQPRLSAFFSPKVIPDFGYPLRDAANLVTYESEVTSSVGAIVEDATRSEVGRSTEHEGQISGESDNIMFENDNGEPGQEPYVSSEKESEVQIADMTTLDAEEDDSVKDELQCSTHQTSASDCSCRLPSSSNVGSIRSHSTLGDPNFVENYFKSSRLHFIGTWRNQYRKRFPSSSKGFKSTEPNLNALTSFQKAAIIHIDMDSLQKNFGMKTGEMLWNHGRGIDNRLVGAIQDCKSIGAEVNWGVRFKYWKDVGSLLNCFKRELFLTF